MADIGCALTCLPYIVSRHDGVDITPGKFLDWIAAKARAANFKDYLTPNGKVYWNSVDKFTGGTVVHIPSSTGAKYTLVEVQWGVLQHWMVKLRDGLVFNPYGYKVEKLAQKKWALTGRFRYYKVTTPSKT